ncbi:hypothetical protein BD626DRAFT_592943 [Schizophyllum amplum]|uniref:Uncharacterized protein n=1 Tax=Schizophyllum amplum TaxID=97359 RepID=A0A550BST6_9AGAR|nr:hypothetical protein BD626DRAFT_592943 [Auriculariopsis ampla]
MASGSCGQQRAVVIISTLGGEAARLDCGLSEWARTRTGGAWYGPHIDLAGFGLPADASGAGVTAYPRPPYIQEHPAQPKTLARIPWGLFNETSSTSAANGVNVHSRTSSSHAIKITIVRRNTPGAGPAKQRGNLDEFPNELAVPRTTDGMAEFKWLDEQFAALDSAIDGQAGSSSAMAERLRELARGAMPLSAPGMKRQLDDDAETPPGKRHSTQEQRELHDLWWQANQKLDVLLGNGLPPITHASSAPPRRPNAPPRRPNAPPRRPNALPRRPVEEALKEPVGEALKEPVEEARRGGARGAREESEESERASGGEMSGMSGGRCVLERRSRARGAQEEWGRLACSRRGMLEPRHARERGAGGAREASEEWEEWEREASEEWEREAFSRARSERRAREREASAALLEREEQAGLREREEHARRRRRSGSSGARGARRGGREEVLASIVARASASGRGECLRSLLDRAEAQVPYTADDDEGAGRASSTSPSRRPVEEVLKEPVEGVLKELVAPPPASSRKRSKSPSRRGRAVARSRGAGAAGRGAREEQHRQEERAEETAEEALGRRDARERAGARQEEHTEETHLVAGGGEHARRRSRASRGETGGGVEREETGEEVESERNTPRMTRESGPLEEAHLVAGRGGAPLVARRRGGARPRMAPTSPLRSQRRSKGGARQEEALVDGAHLVIRPPRTPEALRACAMQRDRGIITDFRARPRIEAARSATTLFLGHGHVDARALQARRQATGDASSSRRVTQFDGQRVIDSTRGDSAPRRAHSAGAQLGDSAGNTIVDTNGRPRRATRRATR